MLVDQNDPQLQIFSVPVDLFSAANIIFLLLLRAQ